MARFPSIISGEGLQQSPQDLLPLTQIKREEKETETGVVESGDNRRPSYGR